MGSRQSAYFWSNILESKKISKKKEEDVEENKEIDNLEDGRRHGLREKNERGISRNIVECKCDIVNNVINRMKV